MRRAEVDDVLRREAFEAAVGDTAREIITAAHAVFGME
jgi:hypothetical protein